MKSFGKHTSHKSFIRILVVLLIVSFAFAVAVPQRNLYTFAGTNSDNLSLLSGSMNYLGGLRAIYYNEGHSLSGLQTTSSGKPDVATFRSRGLSCCNFLSYVYFNYLKNVEGIDISKKYSRPDMIQSSYNLAQTSSFHEWAKYLSNKGLATPLTVIGGGNFNSLRSLSYKTANGTSVTPKVGSLVIYYSESGVTASNYKTKTPMHVAIYIGKEDSIDRVYHQSIYGNDKGKLSWMNAGYITMRSAIVFDFDIDPAEYGKARIKTSFAKLSGDDVTSENSYYADKATSNFTVYKTYSNGTLSDKVTTIARNGDYVKLKSGQYYIQEGTAPKGFNRIPLKKETLQGGESATWTYENTPKVETVSVLIRKQLENGETNPKLEGTQYTIKYYPGKYTKDTLPDKAKRTWVMKTDKEGLVKFDSAHKVSGSGIYMRDDKPVMPYGTVTIEETKTSGFVKDEQLRVIPINGEKTHFSVANAPISRTAEMGGIGVKAVDLNGKPVPGAEFTVYSDSSLQKSLKTITTNEDGIATYGYDLSTEKGYLNPEKTYYIKQTKKAAGYVSSTDIFKVTTKSGKLVYPSQKAVNPRYGGLGIKAVDQNGKALGGAKFGVYSDSECKTLISEMTTKDNGYAYYGYDASNRRYLLTPDRTYYIKQTGRVKGYSSSALIYSVEVKSGQDNWCTDRVINPRNGALGIRVVDQKGNAIEGVKLGIYSDSKCQTLVSEMTSKSNGWAYYGYDRPTGTFLLRSNRTFYIKQITKKAGYASSKDVFSVEVKSGQDNWCAERLVNPRNGALGIKAVDNKGNALGGVKFGIYSDSKCKNLVSEMTSKTNGWAYYGYDASTKRFLLAPNKTYYIKQINSLSGYIASEEIFSVYIESGKDNWCTERAVNVKK